MAIASLSIKCNVTTSSQRTRREHGWAGEEPWEDHVDGDGDLPADVAPSDLHVLDLRRYSTPPHQHERRYQTAR